MSPLVRCGRVAIRCVGVGLGSMICGAVGWLCPAKCYRLFVLAPGRVLAWCILLQVDLPPVGVLVRFVPLWQRTQGYLPHGGIPLLSWSFSVQV